MKSGSSKFGWLVASLLLIATSQSQATTYLFDTSVDGVFVSSLPFGSAGVNSAGDIMVTLPSTYTMSSVALNLNGGSVNAGAYDVTSDVSYGAYGPFNTVLTALSGGNFGSSLTFSVTGYTGINSIDIGGQPIWFAATITDGSASGVIAADAPAPPPPTPLPAALPMFASGLGALGLITWRRKRTKAAAAT